MPDFISVDLRNQVARLNSLTTMDYMYRDHKERLDRLLNMIVGAVMDRQFVAANVSSLSRSLMDQTMIAIERSTLGAHEYGMDRGHYRSSFNIPGMGMDARLSVINDMITFEQAALDIAQKFEQLKLYRFNRFLPYLYETTLNPRAVLLTKIDNYELLAEQIPTLGSDPYLEADEYHGDF